MAATKQACKSNATRTTVAVRLHEIIASGGTSTKDRELRRLGTEFLPPDDLEVLLEKHLEGSVQHLHQALESAGANIVDQALCFLICAHAGPYICHHGVCDFELASAEVVDAGV